MSRQKWVEPLLLDETNNGSNFNNTTTETILFPDFTIPAFYMYDSVHLVYTALGKISATATPTMTFALRLGGVSGTVLAQTSAITLAAATDVIWKVELDIVARANGSSGSILAMGLVEWGVTIKTTNTPDSMGSAGGASGNTPAAVTVDLTQNQALSLTGKFGTANASNSITGMVRRILSLN
jgi:hypothetical protein